MSFAIEELHRPFAILKGDLERSRHILTSSDLDRVTRLHHETLDTARTKPTLPIVNEERDAALGTLVHCFAFGPSAASMSALKCENGMAPPIWKPLTKGGKR